MPQLFGTDGVRGRAGELSARSRRRWRASARRWCARMRPASAPLRMIVGRDTRESGDWIERELARGAGSAGAAISSAGVVPTPAIAYVTREMGFDAGIVISASHNPFHDNGIKVFSGRGEKFTAGARARGRGDRRGRRLGRCRLRPARRSRRWTSPTRTSRTRGSCLPDPERLGRFQLVRRCANGATTTVAPRLFQELGFDVELIGARAGRPQHQPRLRVHPSRSAGARGCASRGARMGIAFDGDGDRAIFVDANGAIVDGDAVLLMCSRQHEGHGPAARATPSSRP